MTKSIRSVLSPLLLISSVCGLRIIEFSAGYPKFWFSFLYIPLLWSIYCFFVIHKAISYIPDDSSDYIIYVSLNMCTVLLSIFFGIYHDKKFRKCLQKLAIMDDTLKTLGTTTDYQKLSKITLWIILGCFVITSLFNYCDYIRWQNTTDALKSICATLVFNYCVDIIIIDDLIFIIILGYLGLKFDQVNKHLHKLTSENERGIKQVWESPTLHSQQCKLSNAPSNEHMTWILICKTFTLICGVTLQSVLQESRQTSKMCCKYYSEQEKFAVKIYAIKHLHLELQKISREINSIFEIQMTWKMVCYFGFIAEFFRELFTEIFIRQHANKKSLFITIIILWLFWYIFRVFLINYMCERVSAKANATGKIISKILYFTYDMEIRENILQFSLRVTQTPLRFYGFRFFQFGYKFLYRYFESILTLAIVLIQADRFKYESNYK